MGLALRVECPENCGQHEWHEHIGSYSYFAAFRRKVRKIPAAQSRFPLLLNHSDCDGQISFADVETLRLEIVGILCDMSEGDRIEYFRVLSVFILACDYAQGWGKPIIFC